MLYLTPMMEKAFKNELQKIPLSLRSTGLDHCLELHRIEEYLPADSFVYF